METSSPDPQKTQAEEEPLCAEYLLEGALLGHQLHIKLEVRQKKRASSRTFPCPSKIYSGYCQC